MRLLSVALLLIIATLPFASAQDKIAPPPLPPGKQKFSLDLPTQDLLYRLESEHHALARMSEERGKPVAFPELPSLVPFGFVSQDHYPPQQICVIPSIVCHRPLYFEDRKTEVEMLGMGRAEPIRAALRFYGQVVTLPVRMVLTPPWSIECHAN